MAAIASSACVARVVATPTTSARVVSVKAFGASSAGSSKASSVKLSTQAAKRGSLVIVAANNSAVACGYASALVDACSDEKVLDSVHTDIETLTAYLTANVMVAKFLANPTMEDGTKKEILETLAKEAGFHPFTKNFLALLIDKRRIGQIMKIVEEFETLYCESTDTQVATVTSAVKLENEQQFMIAKKIQEMTGAKNIKLKPEIDASLLGGFVVTYGKDGSGFIDMSVRGQVQTLRNEIVIV